MVREDTAIGGTEQGQLLTEAGTITTRLRPEGRRRVKSKQRNSPPGPLLGKTISFNDNTHHAASREIDSEWFWDP